MPSTTLRVIDSLTALPASAWNALVGDAPLLSHAFLHALHETGCASPKTGWTPRYPICYRFADCASRICVERAGWRRAAFVARVSARAARNRMRIAENRLDAALSDLLSIR